MDAPPASRRGEECAAPLPCGFLRFLTGWTSLNHSFGSGNGRMKTDFHNAFSRHATDADLLLNKERWANADHHYGLAAECALKALLLQQGISSKDGDIAEREYSWSPNIRSICRRKLPHSAGRMCGSCSNGWASA